MTAYSHSYDNQGYDPPAAVAAITIDSPGSDAPPVTLTALLDSGADATMLPVDVLTAVGARYLRSRQMRGVTGRSVLVDTYLVSIRLGDLTAPGIAVIGINSAAEALIGRDVLNQYVVTLDGLAGEVRITD